MVVALELLSGYNTGMNAVPWPAGLLLACYRRARLVWRCWTLHPPLCNLTCLRVMEGWSFVSGASHFVFLGFRCVHQLTVRLLAGYLGDEGTCDFNFAHL